MKSTAVQKNPLPTLRQEHLSFIDEVESRFEEDYKASLMMQQQHKNQPSPIEAS